LDVRFSDDEFAIYECTPTGIDEEFVAMSGEGEIVEEFVADPGSYEEFDASLEQPYFVDDVLETDEPYIICTLCNGPVEDEVFMTMTGVEDGESTGEEYWTEIIDVVEEELTDESATGDEGKESVDWADYEDSGPIIYTVMPDDSGEVTRDDVGEFPVEEVVDEPVIITMLPDDSGEIVRGEEAESAEGEVEDPVFYTMDDIDVISDDGPTVDPVPEVDDSEVITFGDGGEAADNGPMVEGNVELPVVAANRPNQAGRPQRDGRNRGILQMPPLLPGGPPLLAVVTAMDNRGRLREVQIEVPQTVSLAPVESDLEPLDAAFSLLRGGRISQRLGGLR
jgi:hypothetical protein